MGPSLEPCPAQKHGTSPQVHAAADPNPPVSTFNPHSSDALEPHGEGHSGGGPCLPSSPSPFTFSKGLTFTSCQKTPFLDLQMGYPGAQLQGLSPAHSPLYWAHGWLW